MISIIVPFYNVERYLRQCVESILDQSLSDWELILVDDGSTDRSPRIADEFAAEDNRIRVIHAVNGGPSKARNIGIGIARGELITFVDGDDALYQDSLAILLDTLNLSGADIAMGTFVNSAEFLPLGRSRRFSTTIYSPLDAIADSLYQKRINNSVWSKLYKTTLLKGLRLEDGLLYEDLDFFYQVFLKCHTLAFVDTPVYFYRKNPTSLLHTWNDARKDALLVTECIEEFMAENHPQLLAAARDRRLSANFNFFGLAARHHDRALGRQCWLIIKSHRRNSLFDPNVRLKNKLGILLSYFGPRPLALLSRLIYK